MKNKILQEKRLSAAIKLHPEIKVLNCLGAGNRGEAYLLEGGKVLKVTSDNEEYTTAITLKNRELKHIINICDGWNFECLDDEGYSESLFAIIEEYVDATLKKDIIINFVSVFKDSWFKYYFSDIEPKQIATFDDLDEYMRHPEKYPDAINATKKYVLKKGELKNLQDEFGNMYDQLVSAYVELYKNAPNSSLDLNDGNVGFTQKGMLKVFDMQ